jgi:His-Xaa-Ser repeat protein HxsA
LKIQILRVQIKLKTLGIYEGNVDGILNEATQTALREFQLVKGITASGLMTTPTLNALGVPAVN